jgi:hypothetical protein
VSARPAASPEKYQVLPDGVAPTTLTSDGTTSGAIRIGGLLDGSAWGPVGERLATDPYFAEDLRRVDRAVIAPRSDSSPCCATARPT